MGFLDLINYIFVAIMLGVAVAWIFLIKSMIQSFKKTPYLDEFENKGHKNPSVSIILPARNEQNFIPKCLDSLVTQNYDNYEIIAIDDSSEDDTARIISNYAKKYPKIRFVSAGTKPDGWTGKNWACVQGYKHAKGELLLFTDSDTIHASNVISLAVSHLLSLNLDALTVVPKMVCLDIWTRITLPMLSTFLHTRFSALRVNDPKKKTGYFFGSFFIIKRDVYDMVGTHEAVKSEIVEDGALGKKVKEHGYKMRMVRGDHLVEAVWARDWSSLWNGLKRLMVPLYLQNSLIAVGVFSAVLFLLFMPYLFLAYSAISVQKTSFFALFASSSLAASLVYLAGIIDSRALQLKVWHGMAGPLGSLIVVLGFFFGMVQANSNSAVSWRGRKYSVKDHVQNSISV